LEEGIMSDLKTGVVYPQTEFGNDPVAIRDYVQTAEELGYTHILAYDHVLGANPDRPGGWYGPYTHETTFQEPFVLFAYMAAITRRIHFATGVIILPQRQAALVAKQAASLDVLSGGRLRIGIGTGWNWVEYQSLNQEFHNRGRRFEEQIEVMRLLWTQPLVSFEGRWHSIPDAGINPLPIQRPIPLWFGGHAEPALRRAARLGDGWMPNYYTPAEASPALEILRQSLQEHERELKGFGIEPRLSYGKGNPQDWQTWMEDWLAAGATYMTLNTMGLGFKNPSEHIKAIQDFAQKIGLS
jgi:probable F420-dependent oxidoreductase